MRNIKLILISIFFMLASAAYAGGGMTHMLVAAEAVTKLPNDELRQLLQNNMDTYLVGSYYPDSGFSNGARYGEDSHWDAFLYAFADHLNDKYKNPVVENPKLVAFLFGCISHSTSDIVLHTVFYYDSAAHDFKNDWDTAQLYGDIGIDLLINIDKNQWFNYPREWWIPVSDLVQVYRRMGKPEYNAEEITYGSQAIAVAGFEERMISAPVYPLLRWWRMPWTAKNYYDHPHGGLINAEDEVAKHQMELWNYLVAGKKSKQQLTSHTIHSSQLLSSNPILDFGKKAIEMGAIFVDVHHNADGSINMDTPIVRDENKMRELIAEIIAWLKTSA